MRTAGATEFSLDPDRLAVVGHSAGGYLTLTAGYRISAAPKALISFYGYGNLVGDWYSQPDPFYRAEYDLFTEDEAHAGVGHGEHEFITIETDPMASTTTPSQPTPPKCKRHSNE